MLRYLFSIFTRGSTRKIERKAALIDFDTLSKTQIIKRAIYNIVFVEQCEYFTSKMIFAHLNGKVYLSDISKCLYKLHKKGIIEDSTLITSRDNFEEHKKYCFWQLVNKDGTELQN
jgi:hypothetical protein